MQATKAPSSRKRAGAPTHAELFEPIRIGNCEIKNRIAMAPMNTVLSLDNRAIRTNRSWPTTPRARKAARG